MYAVVRILESYVLAPMIQRHAVDLPPVLPLASVAVSVSLFGAVEVARATLLVEVARLYVEDRPCGG